MVGQGTLVMCLAHLTLLYRLVDERLNTRGSKYDLKIYSLDRPTRGL